jgi:hypothetical protein
VHDPDVAAIALQEQGRQLGRVIVVIDDQ